MKLRFKKTLEELNELSSDERKKFNNVYDLLMIEIPKDEQYIKIDEKLQSCLTEVLLYFLREIIFYEDTKYSYNGHNYNVITDYFINEPIEEFVYYFEDWRDDDRYLEIPDFDYNDQDIICGVILNYLIFHDKEIYYYDEFPNFKKFIMVLINIIRHWNYHWRLNLSEITFLK